MRIASLIISLFLLSGCLYPTVVVMESEPPIPAPECAIEALHQNIYDSIYTILPEDAARTDRCEQTYDYLYKDRYLATNGRYSRVDVE